MGWGVQLGGALIAPALSLLTAVMADERSSITKGKRKLTDETRLRRPAPAWPPQTKVKPNGEDPKGKERKGKKADAGAEVAA